MTSLFLNRMWLNRWVFFKVQSVPLERGTADEPGLATVSIYALAKRIEPGPVYKKSIPLSKGTLLELDEPEKEIKNVL